MCDYAHIKVVVSENPRASSGPLELFSFGKRKHVSVDLQVSIIHSVSQARGHILSQIEQLQVIIVCCLSIGGDSSTE
jgi:hypothetical protein